MNEIPVQSSVLSSVGYDRNSRTLVVRLKSGKRYSYAGVPENVFHSLMSSASKGKYFNKHISRKYKVR